jgi:amidohydrolase
MIKPDRAPRVLLLAVLAFAMGASSAPAQSQQRDERIDRRLESAREELIEIRRDLHRHPEVSGREERTAGVVAARLQALGLEVQTGIGGHGVVGVLEGGLPGPVVAYRADMDAVFSGAPDPVPFASETPGIRHICGHDIHTTVALGLAEVLSEIRADLPGTVKFIFQPAEENIQGAAAMIEDGVLENPAPEAIFAFHTAPLEVGQIGSTEGLSLPGLDAVTVTLRGEGDLQDAARAYARAIGAASTGQDVPLQDFVAAMVGGPRPASGGEDWIVAGMVRAGSPEARARAKDQIVQGLAAIELEGVSYDLQYIDLALPDMINDPELVRSTLETIRSVVGEGGLIVSNTVTPYFSEDFARFQQHMPGAMYWLGVSNSELGDVGMPHSAEYVADEESIFVGVRVMAAVLLEFLGRH